MFRYLSILALLFALSVSPALADDPPAPPEEATEVTEEADEAAPADEGDATEEGGDEATEDPDTTEGDEAAPEESEGDEVATDPAEEIEELDEAMEEAFALVDAIQSKNWPLAVGLFLMLLVFAANKLGLKKLVPPKALPWVAMTIAVCGTVGTGLVVGLGWAEALVQGVLTGVVAIGGWEMLFKHVLGDKKPAADDPPAS